MSRSITPAPSGSLSPDFITVPSSTGFSAGDYVYQKNGDFGVPVSPATANFNVTPASPIYAGTVGGTSTPINWQGFGSPAIGGSTGECAAKLSDGNIVIGYQDNTGPAVRFRIVDTDNVQVVAPVLVSSSIVANAGAPISVIALVGGGFVIHYSNTSSSKVAFAVYTNTGTVTTAIAIDTTYPSTITAGVATAGCALANGGFALAAYSITTTNLNYVRAFDSVGVGAYAWTAVGGTTAGNNTPVNIAARSDSSVCVVFPQSATALRYAIFNSAGGTVVSATITTSNSAATVNVTCLTNDTFVIGYQSDGSSFTPKFRLLPTTNTLGSEISVSTTGISTLGGNAASYITYLKSLSSGGFVYFVGDANSTLYYTFYTAAGTAVYTTPRICPQITYYNGQAYNYKMGMVEISGYLSLYHAGTTVSNAGASRELYNTKISLTTYELLSSVTTTNPVGTVSTNAGTYARSTSLPMKAAYLAANTETLSLNQVISTGNNYTVSPGAVDGNAVDGIKSTTLPDGRFAIVYKNASTGAVSFNVYSIAGILQTTVSVGTSLTGSSYKVRIAALSSGKIAVGYQSATTTLTIATYSSAFSFLGSTTTTCLSQTWFDITGITGDRIALAYQTANQYPNVQVYTSAPALFYNLGNLNTNTTLTTLGIAAAPNGNFWVTWVPSAATPQIWYIYSLSASTYTSLVNVGFGNNTQTNTNCPIAVNSSNSVLLFTANSATTGSFATASANQTGIVSTNANAALLSSPTGFSSGNSAVGTTGVGTFVYFGIGNTNGNLYGIPNALGMGTPSNPPYGLLSGITVSASYGMQACITPSYGYNAVIAWINSSNFAQYAIVNAYPFGATQDITAGVTGSAPTTPLNISQSSSYFLAGVAVSDCPPGGTGQIQTNGVANLNSQYSASTAFQGFDFQNPVTVGVKGTAVGRTVTMIKD